MMLFSCLLILSVFLIILQTTVLQLLPEWFIIPDPLFVLLVFLTIRTAVLPGAPLVLFIGIMMDVVSGSVLGIHPVLYLSLFFSVKWLSKNLVFDASVQQLPLVVLGYLFIKTSSFIFLAALTPEFMPPWSWRDILLELLMLAVITQPLFQCYQWLSTFFSGRKNFSRILTNKPNNRFR